MPELQNQFFDVAKPIGNYLDIRGKQLQNQALEQAPGFKQQELDIRKQQVDLNDMARKANAVSQALAAKNPEQAKAIFDTLDPEDAGKFDLSVVGPDVTLTLPDGSQMKGPRKVVADLWKSKTENPDAWQDPKMAHASIAYLLNQGGDYKAPGMAKSLSELIALKYQQGDKAGAQEAAALEQSTKKAPSTTINLPGEKSFIELGKKQAASFEEARADAKKSLDSLYNIQQAQKLINSKAGIISGVGAKFLTQAGNFLSSRLGFNEASDAVANTEAYKAFMGREVGSVISLFGQGTGLSDADREYAEAIAGGQIELNEKSLRLLLDINRRTNIRKLKAFNEQADEITSNAHKGELLYDPHIKVPKELKEDKGLMEEIKDQVEYLHMGAKQAPDGNWYVETAPGKFAKVDK